MQYIIFFKIILCFISILITACGNSAVSDKKTSKKISLCPNIIIDKKANNLTLSSSNTEQKRLTAVLKTSDIVCSRKDGIMTLSFDINVTAEKTNALYDSHNAYIPISYYIALNLNPIIDNKISKHTETTQGTYFMTLKKKKASHGQHEPELSASQRRTVALQIQDYNFKNSTVRLGFLSEDKTIIVN